METETQTEVETTSRSHISELRCVWITGGGHPWDVIRRSGGRVRSKRVPLEHPPSVTPCSPNNSKDKLRRDVGETGRSPSKKRTKH